MARTPLRLSPLVALLVPIAASAAGAEPALWRPALEVTVSHAASAAAFVDERNGVTVGPHGAIFTTRDGGQTWAPAQNDSACRFSVELLPGGQAWSGGVGSDVRASSDRGARWSRVAPFGSGIRALSFVDPRRGVAASADAIGLTGDGGGSWSQVALPAKMAPIAMVSLSEEGGAMRLRALDEDGALWSSVDAGATWANDPSPVKHPVMETMRGARAALRFRPDGQGILAAILGEDGGPRAHVWRTRDGGRTWVEEALAPALPPAALTLSPDGALLVSVDGASLRVYRAD